MRFSSWLRRRAPRNPSHDLLSNAYRRRKSRFVKPRLEWLEDRLAPSGPSLSTTPSGTVILGSGIKLTDSATLSGGSSPTGSMTFTLTAPGGTTVDTETVTVSGDGTYNTPNGFLPGIAGTYEWEASYSGDSSNPSVTSAANAEPVGVTPASPTITTTANPTTEVVGAVPAVSYGGKLLGNALSYAAGGNTGTTPIALLGADYSFYIADVESTLAAYGGFSITSIDVVNSTPTLATLENYKAVLVWGYNGFKDGTQLGNVLANYVNAGGGVVVAWAADATGDLGGTWASGGYSPYGISGRFVWSTPNATLGTVELPSSPVMNGVTSFDIGPGDFLGGFAARVSLAPGATDIADLTSGYSLAAQTTGFPGKIIGLNFYPPSSNVDPYSWPAPLPVAGTLTDSAVLSGGYHETGTITFTLTAPGGGIVDTETVPVSGDGTYTTPTGAVPTETGTYFWVASYSGDSNNNCATSGVHDEPVVVTPYSPTITTQASPATEALATRALYDYATLSGGFGPTGTVTFTLTSPSGTVVETETVSVTGNNIYFTPTGVVPTQVGTYYWAASYSGDNDNNGATSGTLAEPVVVTPASPTITTSAALTATLTGLNGPDALAFDRHGNLYVANSSGTTVSEFAPDATTPSATVTGLSGPDALAFDASGNLYVANSGNGTVSEFAPGATTPSATLTRLVYPVALAFDASGNLYVADEVAGTVCEFAPGATTASATLSGLACPVALAFDASGNLYVVDDGFNRVSEFAPGATTPSANLTGLYMPVALAFDANGNLYVADDGSDTVSEFAPGATTPSANLTGLSVPVALAFDASGNLYVADDAFNTVSEFAPGATTPSATLTGLYMPVALAFDASGNLYVADNSNGTVSKFAPTQVVGTGVLQDTAFLTGGFTPTGTITFTLTSPTGTVVETETVPVSGNGTYTTPTSVVPTQTGTYYWVVSYSGDSFNNSAASGALDEPVVVSPASPTITTTAVPATEVVGTAALKDMATLSGGFTPTGTITFTLTSPGGTVVDTETVRVSGDGTYTTPTGKVPTQTGTSFWVASYSGDSDNNGATSGALTEPVVVTPPPNLDVPAGTTLMLTGNNTYGPVTVEGTLTVKGSLTTNMVSLDGPSAVLNGTGSVTAPVVVTGAASGASVGGTGGLTITAVGATGVEVQSGANNVTVNGVTVTGSTTGILIDPGSGNTTTITGSTIMSNAQGLEVLNGCVTATGNIIGGSSGAGNNYGVYIPAGANPLLTLEGNNISFNTTGMQNASSMALTALFNWWGNVAGPGPVDGLGRNPVVGVNVNDYTPYALDAASVGPNATGLHLFNGTGADGNVYVTGTLGANTITATVDAVNPNLIHVTVMSASGTTTGSYTRGASTNRLIVYGFGASGANTHDTITVSGSWNTEIHSGPGNNRITTLGTGSDVIFGGGNDIINAGTSGNNVIVGGLSTGKTGAPTAPQMSAGKGANLFIAGDLDCTLAPLAPSGRLDYATLRSMDDLWASGAGGMADAMDEAALFSVVNTPGAIMTGTARAVITPGSGKSWYIVKGAGNPVTTPAGLNADYVAGSTAGSSYRQAIQ